MARAEEIGREWFQAIAAHDIDRALELLGEDVDFRSPAGDIRGREQVRPFLESYVAGFPDAVFEVSAVISGGDEAAAMEGTYRGTNTGAMQSPAGEMQPTGRSISLPYVTIIEADGEHITSHRAYWDQVAFMGQLGLLPEGPG
jgi:steroid delta-isomerase-like uncharacterized protein